MVLSRRVLINLISFAALFVVFSAWAASNVLQFHPLSPSYTMHADFVDASGIQPRFEVGYLGTHLGQVTKVQVKPGYDVVTFSVDHGRTVPAGSTAAINRKSAVGEPYIDITPPPGVGPHTPTMRPGSTIPLNRTQPALQYSALLDAFQQLLGGIPPQALHNFIEEMAAGFGGRAGDIRTILSQSSALLSTLAANTTTISQTLSSLTQATGLLAQHEQQIGSSTDNSNTFLATIRQARGNIDTILQQGPPLAQQVAAFMSGSMNNVACAFGSFGNVFAALGTRQNAANFAAAEQNTPQTANVLLQDTDNTPLGLAIRTITIANTNHQVPVYPQRIGPPNPPVVPSCGVHLTPVTAAGAVGSVAGAGTGAGTSGLHANGVPGLNRGGGPRANTPGFFTSHKWLWLLLAILLVAAVAAAVARRAWKWKF